MRGRETKPPRELNWHSIRLVEIRNGALSSIGSFARALDSLNESNQFILQKKNKKLIEKKKLKWTQSVQNYKSDIYRIVCQFNSLKTKTENWNKKKRERESMKWFAFSLNFIEWKLWVEMKKKYSEAIELEIFYSNRIRKS